MGASPKFNVGQVVTIGAGAVLVLYVLRNGVKGAAHDIGEGAVDLVVDTAGGVAGGVIDGVSTAAGIPTTQDTTTNPAVARYIMDHQQGGQLQASLWSGAPAYMKALFMDPGTGTPPPPGTKLAARFPPPFDSDWD